MRPASKRIAFALVTLLAPALGAGCSGTSGGTCTVGGKTYSYGQGFMDQDGCNSCTCSAQGVACTTKECVDSGAPEVGSSDGPGSASDGHASDAVADGRASDAVADGGACTLTDTYRFGTNGGFVAYQGESTLSPPDHYRHVRTTFRGDGPSMTECAPALPACGTQDLVSLYDITRDLADADVRAAFAMATPPLYGRDTRPVDGTVYQVLRADGHGVIVGSPCGTPASAGCPAIPRGVQALVDQLRMLDEAQLARPECASLAKP